MADGGKQRERTWIVALDGGDALEREMLKVAGIIERVGGMVTVTALRAETDLEGSTLIETEAAAFAWRPYGGPVRKAPLDGEVLEAEDMLEPEVV